MAELTEPESLQKIRFVNQAAQQIESCQKNLLITPEDRAKFLEALNDKAHSIIEAALADFN